MQIASMTSMFYSSRGTKEKTTAVESIRRLKNAGFERIDLNLCGLSRNENEFCFDDWEDRAYELKAEAEKIGVTFVQSHSPYWQNALAGNPGYEETFKSGLLRAVEVEHICGISRTVVHAMTDPDAPGAPVAHHIEYTKKMHHAFLEKCREYGIRPAFENGSDVERKGKPFSRACDLIMLTEALKDYNAGICWDFGHANMTMDDQTADILQMKGRLICVHTHDNNGKYDAHVMPFIGTIAWEKIMPALRKAGFDNDLVLEVAQNKNLPKDLQDDSARLCAEVTRRLVRFYEENE